MGSIFNDYSDLNSEDLLLLSVQTENIDLAKIAIDAGARNIGKILSLIDEHDCDLISFCHDVQMLIN